MRSEVQVFIFAERQAELKQGPKNGRGRLAKVLVLSANEPENPLDHESLTGGPRIPINITPPLDEEMPPMTRIAIQITVDTIRSARSMFRNPQRGEAGSANAFGLPAMVTVFVVVRLTGNWQ